MEGGLSSSPLRSGPGVRPSDGGDAVAQEVQLGNGEDALLQVEGQAVGGEDGEQRAEVGPPRMRSNAVGGGG